MCHDYIKGKQVEYNNNSNFYQVTLLATSITETHSIATPYRANMFSVEVKRRYQLYDRLCILLFHKPLFIGKVVRNNKSRATPSTCYNYRARYHIVITMIAISRAG